MDNLKEIDLSEYPNIPKQLFKECESDDKKSCHKLAVLLSLGNLIEGKRASKKHLELSNQIQEKLCEDNFADSCNYLGI